MARDKGDEELRKKNGMERRKCYFALYVSVAHFAPHWVTIPGPISLAPSLRSVVLACAMKDALSPMTTGLTALCSLRQAASSLRKRDQLMMPTVI